MKSTNLLGVLAIGLVASSSVWADVAVLTAAVRAGGFYSEKGCALFAPGIANNRVVTDLRHSPSPQRCAGAAAAVQPVIPAGSVDREEDLNADFLEVDRTAAEYYEPL